MKRRLLIPVLCLLASIILAFTLLNRIPEFWYLSVRKIILVFTLTVSLFTVVSIGIVSKFVRPVIVSRPKQSLIICFLVAALLAICVSAILWITGARAPIPPSRNHLEIVFPNLPESIPGAPQAVLLEVKVQGNKIPWSSFTQQGEWSEEISSWDSSALSINRPGSLYYEFLSSSGGVVNILFLTNPEGGAVEVRLNNRVTRASLSEPIAGQMIVSMNTGSSIDWTAPTGIETLAYAILFFIISSFVNEKKLKKFFQIICLLIGKIFAWYEETTPNFVRLVFVSLVISIALSTYLLVEPLVVSPKYSAIQPVNLEQKPDVILIVADALAAEDMSVYGYHLPTTPKLEKMVKDWTLYTNVQAAQTCTLGMLPSTITGRYPYINAMYLTGDWVRSQAGWIDLSQLLRRDGYQTWWVGYATPGFYHLGPGFENHVCAPNTLHELLTRSRFQYEIITKAKGLSFTSWLLGKIGDKAHAEACSPISLLGKSYVSRIQNGEMEQPVFIYNHYGGVHGPWYNGGRYLGSFLPVESGMVGYEDQHEYYGGPYKPEDQVLVDQLRLRYDEFFMGLDEDVTTFIERLKQADLYNSAMIIFIADHGQTFNHGYSTHCTPFVSYDQTHVPLFIKYPYQQEGKIVGALASNIDLVPTIIDVLGYEYPANWFDGKSLIDLEQNPDENRIVISRQLAPGQHPYGSIAAADNQYRLILMNGKEYFFDYKDDPTEMNNLITEFEGSSRLQQLREAIDNYIMRATQLKQGAQILDLPPLTP